MVSFLSQPLAFLLAVGLVVGLVILLRSWGRALRVVDTPTFCAMCQICYISAEDCRGAIPMARRWFRPHEVFGNEAWVCDLCIFDLFKATCFGSVAWRLADSSWIPYGWELAVWLLMLTVPSRLVTCANIYKKAPERWRRRRRVHRPRDGRHAKPRRRQPSSNTLGNRRASDLPDRS
jgi:hypothetical protein